MANKSLFSSIKSIFAPANTLNEAGGVAYKLEAKHRLAQIAATGCFNGTFYANAETQLVEVRKLIDQIDDNTFLAKLAVYARDRAYMKDMPVALLAVLSKRDPQLLHKVFSRVVDNGRVLRTLFQMVRSGQFGRKGLSSSLQRAFQRWLNEASVGKLLSASIGNNPSLRDVLRMARPKPNNNARRALFGWLTGKDVAKWTPATEADLPPEVQALTMYRQAESIDDQVQLMPELTSIRWDLLADAATGSQVWKAIARNMGPQALRMNLNTLARQGVFGQNGKDSDMVKYVAERLADANEVRRSKQFPYQFLAAYLNANENVPQAVKTALHKAAEIACGNIPELPAPVLVGLDTSGSMTSPITGQRGHGATSNMRCVDVAALFAAAILRRNPESVVVPFDTQAYEAKLDPNDSILSLSERLAKYGGGGTDCSLPLQMANTRYRKRKFAGVVLVSDNQSWVYQHQAFAAGTNGATGLLTQWNQFVQNQKRLGVISPKLICIDLQPSGSSQAPEREEILNIGGFSDAVFNVITAFLGNDANRFVAEIEAIVL
jgi:60 kDa SS-A/Ro ribonucleoprotein